MKRTPTDGLFNKGHKMTNEQLIAKALLLVFQDGQFGEQQHQEKIKNAFLELYNAAPPEAQVRFERASQYPTLDFQMPVVVFGNGNTEADHMNNYQTAKDTCER